MGLAAWQQVQYFKPTSSFHTAGVLMNLIDNSFSLGPTDAFNFIAYLSSSTNENLACCSIKKIMVGQQSVQTERNRENHD